jgi:RNA polymerase sigma-B factor
LILAVDRFEPDRGIDFLSFAVPTTTGEVLRYLRTGATLRRQMIAG